MRKDYGTRTKAMGGGMMKRKAMMKGSKPDFLDLDKDKNVFWTVPAAAVMVHKFVDPCRREYIWYKGHTDF